MIKITDEQIAEARKKIAKGEPEAVGYRLMLFPIEAISGMEEAQMENMPTLAAQGFITKTDDQKERESKGTHYYILVSKGEDAFVSQHSIWAEEGDLLIGDRYAGVGIEIPPGSKQMFRFCNDESVLGRIK